VLYLQRVRASKSTGTVRLWTVVSANRQRGMQRKRRAYCPPSWIVPLYWVIRRAIKLNELPVQNRRPRTRTILPLLTVPKRLSVFGCWNT
jgi:hypothetical protein